MLSEAAEKKLSITRDLDPRSLEGPPPGNNSTQTSGAIVGRIVALGSRSRIRGDISSNRLTGKLSDERDTPHTFLPGAILAIIRFLLILWLVNNTATSSEHQEK